MKFLLIAGFFVAVGPVEMWAQALGAVLMWISIILLRLDEMAPRSLGGRMDILFKENTLNGYTSLLVLDKNQSNRNCNG